MVSRSENASTDMRNGKSEEHYRPTIGGYNSRKHSCNYDYLRTSTRDIKTKISGILFAKQKHIQGFCQ